MKVNDTVRIVDIEDVATLVGDTIYYDKETDEEVYDRRYPDTRPPFGKKMMIVKIDERMSPKSIAVSAMNKKNDWRHWWWIPEKYIKEVL